VVDLTEETKVGMTLTVKTTEGAAKAMFHLKSGIKRLRWTEKVSPWLLKRSNSAIFT
jgi:hypothetical protein